MYKSYKILVMLFGLCSMPLIFTTLIDIIFEEEMIVFVIVYVDDILVYSKMVEEHAQHLKVVLQKLRNNKLYANREKNDFVQQEIEFLDHMMTRNVIKPDMKKIKVIQEWKRLSNQKQFRSFFGLANYYCHFIWRFYKVVRPWFDLLKEKVFQEWDKPCHQAFREFKSKLILPPIFMFPDFNKSFEVYMDVSDFVIDGVLMQDERSIVYESKKVDGCQRKWPIYEKLFLL